MNYILSNTTTMPRPWTFGHFKCRVLIDNCLGLGVLNTLLGTALNHIAGFPTAGRSVTNDPKIGDRLRMAVVSFVTVRTTMGSLHNVRHIFNKKVRYVNYFIVIFAKTNS